MRSNVIRLVSVLLGALPATWLAQSAVLVVWVALDNNGPIQRTLGVLWGVSGLLGAVGAWLIIFDVGSGTKVTRRLVIFLVSAGIAAASVLMIGAFQQLFSSSSPDRILMLCVASAIGVGVFQICRVSSASSWLILGWVAAGYIIGIGFVVSDPLHTRTKVNHFVVPTGYRGPIALVSDPTFESDSYWDGERFVHTVPATAVVCVRSDDVIRPSFKASAVYANGAPIYARSVGLPNPPDAESPRIAGIGSWWSRIEDGSMHWFAVGSEAEVNGFTRRFFGDGDAIELAMPDGVTIDQNKSDRFAYLRQYCSKQ